MRNAEFDRLEAEWGISFPGAMDYTPPPAERMALDAQPGLITQSNGAIPSFLTQWVDPKIIKVLVAPMKGAEILGEVRKGDWLTQTAMFPLIENVGEVSNYGDFNNNGMANANVNWPQRQAFLYQTITQWGSMELARMGLAGVDWAGQLNQASVLVLNKFQNRSYFFGIAGLQNYGLLNNPGLSAPLQPGPKAFNLQPHGPWITSGVVTATANEIFNDIQSLYLQLVTQSNGTIDMDASMTLAMSPASEVALTATNAFNVNVADLLKKNFPNLRIVTAVEYATAAGNLVQLIAGQVDGQETGYAAFNAKMMAGPVIPDLSSFKQKKAQGTWGAIILQPFAIAQMLGV